MILLHWITENWAALFVIFTALERAFLRRRLENKLKQHDSKLFTHSIDLNCSQAEIAVLHQRCDAHRDHVFGLYEWLAAQPELKTKPIAFDTLKRGLN